MEKISGLTYNQYIKKLQTCYDEEKIRSASQ